MSKLLASMICSGLGSVLLGPEHRLLNVGCTVWVQTAIDTIACLI